MHKHRILFIHDEGQDVGGGGISILNLVKALDRNRFEPMFLCPGNWKFKQEVIDFGIKVYASWLPSWTKGKSLPLIIPSIIRLIYFLKREKICLIYYCGMMYVPFGFFATKFHKIPSVGRLYYYDANKKWHLKVYLVRTVSAFTTPSNFSKSILVKGEIEENRLNVIYHGIPDKKNFIPKKEARKLLNLDENAPILLNIGRIVPQKNLETLIQATANIKSRIPDVKCLIVGEISSEIKDKETYYYYKSLEKLVNQLGVKENVSFVGFKLGEEKSLYLTAMDLFILPSRFEDFGIVLLEAMANERPVIASNVGGIPEVVKDGVTGFLVPPSDPQTLSNKILYLLNNPKELEKMGLEGRERFKTQFSMDREANEYEHLFASMLKCTHLN